MSGDPYWYNVTLLISGNTHTGGYACIDDSNYGVLQAGPGVLSAFFPSGGPVGNNPYIDLSNPAGSTNTGYDTFNSNPVVANGPLDLSAGDYTIEGWFYARGSATIFFSKDNVANLVCSISGGGTLEVSVDGVTTFSAGLISLNTWHHIALVMSGNAFVGYLDGTAIAAPSSVTRTSWVGSKLYIGGSSFGAQCEGNFTQFRVTQGVARYTSNFSPPSAVFPNTLQLPTPGDPYFANVSLLLTMDGYSGSPSFFDASVHTNPMTTISPTVVDTSRPQFGTGAANMGPVFNDGAGITCPGGVGSVFDMGSGNFTVELWVFMAVNSTANFYVIGDGYANGGTGQWAVTYDFPSGQFSIGVNSGGAAYSARAPAIGVFGVWHSIAFVKNGTTLTAYLDGVAGIPLTVPAGALAVPRSTLLIGSAPGLAGHIPGEMDEIRVTKGIARYTSNYTPTGPFGGSTVSVPNVLGELAATAEANIISAGLAVGTITNIVDPLTPLGNVSTQNPSGGTLVAVGTPVDLGISFLGTVTTIPRFLNDEGIGGAYFGAVLNLVESVYMPGREPFLEGAANLIINRYKQEPQDSRQRGVDYTFFLVPGETIQSVSVTGINAQGVPQASTVPVVTPLVVTGVIIDPSGLKFAYTVSGGQNGIEYTVQFTTTTQIQTSVVEEIFSINVLIEDQFP